MYLTGLTAIAFGFCLASIQAAVLPDCTAVKCAEIACTGSYIPSGECCSVCPKVMPPLDRCALAACAIPVDCVETYTPPGQCCPVCRTGKDCYYKGSVYQNGQTFKDDCNTCTCSNGFVSCTEMACGQTKPGTCPKPLGTGICVSLCNADSDCPSDKKCCSNGCGRTCQTPDGAGHTMPGTCPKPIGTGICVSLCKADNDCPSNKKCCSNGCGQTCQTPVGFANDCYYKGSVYKDGERFKDDCNWCTCHNGAVGCTKIGCVSDPCKGRVCPMIKCIGITYTPPGQCCPVCRNIVPEPDCSKVACLMVHCEGQYTKPGDCCPSCPIMIA